MVGNRSRDTKPELAVRRILHAAGLRYRVAYRPVPGLRRTADIAFTRQRVAVFIDGCFWHSCPLHGGVAPKTNSDYWVPKLEKNKARDLDTNLLLQEAGWTVMRFWEHELPEDVAAQVSEVVGRSRAPIAQTPDPTPSTVEP